MPSFLAPMFYTFVICVIVVFRCCVDLAWVAKKFTLCKLSEGRVLKSREQPTVGEERIFLLTKTFAIFDHKILVLVTFFGTC